MTTSLPQTNPSPSARVVRRAAALRGEVGVGQLQIKMCDTWIYPRVKGGLRLVKAKPKKDYINMFERQPELEEAPEIIAQLDLPEGSF